LDVPMQLTNIPNAITIVRALLVPVVAFALVARDYDLALTLFLACAIGDFVDGYIARRFDLRTRFGAIADPLADKAIMLAATLLLAWQGWLPWWFALLVVLRDVVIVAGALAYHLRVGHVDMAPTRLSKANTAFEFVLLAGVLALAAELIEPGAWLRVLLWVCTATVIASGVQYVVVWSRKATAAASGQRANAP
jgi:cardiolipin synthase